MLEINTTYRALPPTETLRLAYSTLTLPPPAPDFTRRELHVLRRLGQGEFGVVFEVRDPASGHHFAAKVPRRAGAADIRLMQTIIDEAGVLTRLQAAFPDGERTPFPRWPQLVAVEVDGADGRPQPVPVLLMEVVEYPQLFEVYYWKLQEAGHDPVQRFAVERFAWEAAFRYLDLLGTAKDHNIQMQDRKHDTFLWDDAHDRLIVLDWGDTGRGFDEVRALRRMAQLWYVITTGLKAQRNLPPELADHDWRDISLFGRKIVKYLDENYQGDEPVVSIEGAIRQVRYLLQTTKYPDDLKSELADQLARWTADEIAAADENRLLKALRITDLARRCCLDDTNRDQATALYARLWDALGAGVSRDEVQAMLDGVRQALPARASDRFRTLLDQALKLVAAHPEGAEWFSISLRQLLDTLQTLEDDPVQMRAYARQLESRIQALREDFYRAGILRREGEAAGSEPELMRTVEQHATCYRLLMQVIDAAAAGQRAVGLEALDQLAHPVFRDILTELRLLPGESQLTTDRLAAIRQWMQTLPGAEVAEKAPDHLMTLDGALLDAIRACREHHAAGKSPPDAMAPLLALRDRCSVQVFDQPLPLHYGAAEIELLHAYADLTGRLAQAYYPYLTDTSRTEAVSRWLAALTEAETRLPRSGRQELAAWAQETPLAQALQAQYERVQAAIDDDRNMISLSRAARLNMLLARFLGWVQAAGEA